MAKQNAEVVLKKNSKKKGKAKNKFGPKDQRPKKDRGQGG
jgi:hypothetical protein